MLGSGAAASGSTRGSATSATSQASSEAALKASEDAARGQLMELVKDGRLSISQAMDAQGRHASAAVRLALEAAKVGEKTSASAEDVDEEGKGEATRSAACAFFSLERALSQRGASLPSLSSCSIPSQRPCPWRPLLPPRRFSAAQSAAAERFLARSSARQPPNLSWKAS